MRRSRSLLRTAAVAGFAMSAVASTGCDEARDPFGAEAEAWVEAWFRAGNEGLANVLPFYDPDVVWEDRTGGHLFTDRDDFVSYSSSLLGDVDPSVVAETFVSADEVVVSYWWPTWHPAVDYLNRAVVGRDGIEHLVNTGATVAGRVYVPNGADFDAVDALARRWIEYWNAPGVAADDLYTTDATIEDSLADARATGTAIPSSVDTGRWPNPPPVSIRPLPSGIGDSIMNGPPLTEGDLEEIGLVVDLDDPRCPRSMAVFLGWDGERIVWERRYHEVDAARACEDVSSFRRGWWEGLVAPEPILRDFTGVVRVPRTGHEVSVYNGTPQLEQVVAELLQSFVDAGIGVSDVEEFAFLQYRSKCTAWDGFSTNDIDGAAVNICLDQSQICLDEDCTRLEPHARLMMLHELAHVWLFTQVDDELQRRFMEFVGVDVWNDTSVGWHDRGIERAASAIAVGVAGDLGPEGCIDDRYCDVLPGSFELLTGSEPSGR